MYISRLYPNVRHPAARRDLAKPYQLHRTIMRAFPAEMPASDNGARVLFRLDERSDQAPILLVQAPLEPDWSTLPANYLAQAAETKPFAPRFVTGMPVAFRLRANPTRRMQTATDGARDANGRNTGKRVGLFKREEQEVWVQRHLENGGFQIVRVTISATAKQTDTTRVDADNRRHLLTLADVRFDGVAIISDAAAALRTLQCGVGSGKAFGFGLLSLARVG